MPARPLAVFVVAALAVASACAHGQVPAPARAPSPVRDTVPSAVVTPADTVPARSANDSSRVHDYRGAYSTGFELSWFEPCDARRGDALWWVTLTEDARLQRDSLIKLLPRKPTQGLAVQWRGTVSPVMRSGAGQMGRGSRYILVTRVLGLRALGDDGACGAPGRSGD